MNIGGPPGMSGGAEPASGLAYFQTVAPADVTSKIVQLTLSQTSVFPLAGPLEGGVAFHEGPFRFDPRKIPEFRHHAERKVKVNSRIRS
jgi:hypothetical protein